MPRWRRNEIEKRYKDCMWFRRVVILCSCVKGYRLLVCILSKQWLLFGDQMITGSRFTTWKTKTDER